MKWTALRFENYVGHSSKRKNTSLTTARDSIEQFFIRRIITNNYNIEYCQDSFVPQVFRVTSLNL